MTITTRFTKSIPSGVRFSYLIHRTALCSWDYLLGAVFSLGILATPAFTQAAALTTAQSTSLIAVVQSSPGTLASAFVNLITAFSNITANQATSLIAVVQAAPSTPANAFVDLLTSFTDDTSITQSTIQDSAPKTKVDTLTQQVEALQQSQNTAPAPVPTPPAPVVKELKINREPYRQNESGVYYTENGKGVLGVPVTISAPDGDFNANGKRYNLTATSKTLGAVGTQGKIGVFFQYMPATKEDRTITVIANGVTESIVGAGNELAEYIIEDGVVKKIIITGNH